MSAHRDLKQLCDLACRNDESAFLELHNRESSYLARILAEKLSGARNYHIRQDILQDAWCCLWGKVCAMALLGSDGEIRAWMIRVVEWRCLDWWRREYRRTKITQSVETLSADVLAIPTGTSDDIGRVDAEDMFRSLLERLTPLQKQVLLFRYEELMTRVAIAEQLGETKGKIASIYHQISCKAAELTAERSKKGRLEEEAS